MQQLTTLQLQRCPAVADADAGSVAGADETVGAAAKPLPAKDLKARHLLVRPVP